MSHTIYNTEGFILKSLNFGEANRYYFIFTRDFGLIKASAQGVRQLVSKLKSGLTDFSLTSISLVRGKEFWRLTRAEKNSDFRNIDVHRGEKFKLISRIFSLLLRLLHGEEKNELIFDNLFHGFAFLQAEELTPNELANFECILALRILSALGYIGHHDNLNDLISSPYWNRETIMLADQIRPYIIGEINKSLKETHL